ncbi:hypothetical protein PP175_25440 (plasmid) [Aneurinibacillus sp. Ricciae_BoGa-3]|uniref:hypothetical protein n=1 Tax=Aneurinibacillus sp. Ricciae_BoGa-3 TaxID=3022697 RepID=UPI00234108D1|nr:hypothetical protein [Aneurinibacillus sp. Ricciae_BoGa-3]WCK57414.1 hypothetical protein PP175_25440 [Aneurinibacillus sp. Ricciae_BoGa-3]
MNNFQEMVSKLDEKDVEEAQIRDFNSWLNFLVEYPQGLYDMLHTDADPEWSGLSKKEVRERKAILDAAFLYIQSTMEDISAVLKEKYPKDMMEKHNRIHI